MKRTNSDRRELVHRAAYYADLAPEEVREGIEVRSESRLSFRMKLAITIFKMSRKFSARGTGTQYAQKHAAMLAGVSETGLSDALRRERGSNN